MTALKIIRILAWTAVAALALMVGLSTLGYGPGARDRGTATLPLAATVGGPFALTAQDGQRLTSEDLKGKPFVLFFGFTNCPDVCPTTLLELTNRLEELGRDADRLRLVFVSVDPEQDTPEFLRRYLANFDKRIIGLTGTPEEIAAVTKAYRAIYRKVATKDGYTVDHTTTVYLMDAQGRFTGTIGWQENPETQRAKLKRLAGS